MEWTISSEGVIDYEDFVNYEAVEKLFGSIRGYLIFMAIKKTDIEQMNYQCEKDGFPGISDTELMSAAEDLAEYLHWPKPGGMDEGRKLMLAQRLRGKYGCGKKQLARVLDIRLSVADRVLT